MTNFEMNILILKFNVLIFAFSKLMTKNDIPLSKHKILSKEMKDN